MIQLLSRMISVFAIALLSVNAYAGGANCDSKKGHQEMSVEMMQQLKDKHHWIFSDESINKQDGVSEGEGPREGEIKKQDKGLIGA